MSSLPPKFSPKAPPSRLAEAVAVCVKHGRLNPVLIERALGVSIVESKRIIQQLLTVLQEHAR